MFSRIMFTLILGIVVVQYAIGQQNFFNVPSSDITPQNKLFFQQQINFLSDGIASNTTFSYGLGKGFEAGVNLLGVTYSFKKGLVTSDTVSPYFPLLAANFQKRFQLSQSFGLALGTQLGLGKTWKAANYTYLNGIFHNETTKIITGVYYSTDGFFGQEQRSFFENGVLKNIGYQLGIEQAIIKEKLVFQADLISGKHTLGETVIGAAYFLNKNWVLSGGFQLPLFKSKSTQAVVLELTYVP